MGGRTRKNNESLIKKNPLPSAGTQRLPEQFIRVGRKKNKTFGFVFYANPGRARDTYL